MDVIVGFPGEGEEEFLETYNYLNQLDISYLHVFTYSERVNTTANKLPGRVYRHTRADRSKMLHILSDKKRRFFYEQNVGKTYKVLWEADNEQNMMFGFTENYIKVKTTYDPALVNEIAEVKLSELDADMVFKCQILHWELVQ